MSGRARHIACAVVVTAALSSVGGGCEEDGRPVPASTQRSGGGPPPAFTEIASSAGINGEPGPFPDGTFEVPELTSGGVALFDADGDGRLDIFHTRYPAPGAGGGESCRLWRRQPDGTFRDVTREAGLSAAGYWQGAAVGDADGDGDADLYVTNFGGADRFYRNTGDGAFTDDTRAGGFPTDVPPGHWASSAAFVDYDRDGDLDLYVAHFTEYEPGRVCRDSAGRREYCAPHLYGGAPAKLYRNDGGGGAFTDVSATAGIAEKPGRGWGVTCADLTGDGWVDIYQANDGQPAYLWVNRTDGTFVEDAAVRGCAVGGLGQPEAGMGVAVDDFNGDGRFDLIKTHIVGEKNTLYVSSPDDGQTFTDHSAAAGTAAVDLAYTGWGCGFFDYDHDGILDLAVVNGRVRRAAVHPGAALGAFWSAYAEPNLLFRGQGGGRFADASASAGDFTGVAEVTHGLAFGDLDDDGDVDLVSAAGGNVLRVYRNDVPKGATHWLCVRTLTGRRDALGAAVTVTAGGRRRVRVAHSAYSYLSSSDSRAHFGLGAASKIDSLEVAWPSGRSERFAVDAVDRHVTVREGDGEPAAPAPKRTDE